MMRNITKSLRVPSARHITSPAEQRWKASRYGLLFLYRSVRQRSFVDRKRLVFVMVCRESFLSTTRRKATISRSFSARRGLNRPLRSPCLSILLYCGFFSVCYASTSYLVFLAV